MYNNCGRCVGKKVVLLVNFYQAIYIFIYFIIIFTKCLLFLCD